MSRPHTFGFLLYRVAGNSLPDGIAPRPVRTFNATAPSHWADEQLPPLLALRIQALGRATAAGTRHGVHAVCRHSVGILHGYLLGCLGCCRYCNTQPEPTLTMRPCERRSIVTMCVDLTGTPKSVFLMPSCVLLTCRLAVHADSASVYLRQIKQLAPPDSENPEERPACVDMRVKVGCLLSQSCTTVARTNSSLVHQFRCV